MAGNGRSDYRPAHSSPASFHPRSLSVSVPKRLSHQSPPNPNDLESNVSRTDSSAPLHQNASTTSFESTAPTYHWLSKSQGGGTGDEPGVDVRSKRDEDSYGHLKGRTEITVVDYSSDLGERNVRADFDGERLREWLDSEHSQRDQDEDGKFTGVRWIHVNGLNWSVIKTLTLEFGLHPLAVEDALRAANSPRSKLDFYKNHLYLQVLVQHMHASDEDLLSRLKDGAASGLLDDPSSTAPRHASGAIRRLEGAMEGNKRQGRLPEGVEGVFEPTVDPTRGRSHNRPMYAKDAHRMTVDELSAKYMVPIRRGILSAFMTRDGTLITVMKRPIKEMLQPVYARLEDEQSLLRRSGDVSMLTQALLDISVDLAIELSQTFEAEILKLEASVLVDPSMETVRHLHVLSSQLIRIRRSLTPLLHVAYNIRDQDVARAVAAGAMSGNQLNGENHAGQGGARMGDKNHMSRDTQWLVPSSTSGPERPSRPSTPTSVRSTGGAAMVQGMTNAIGPTASMTAGFFTPMTKVYIGDVLDHLEIIVSNMDQFVATCDHLTDYVFNVLSFQTNASMERLSIVTVVFLPLTFIASYFGMNFDGFDELHGPVSYFWKVAAPCTVLFFLTFSFSYLRAGAVTFWRKLGMWQRRRVLARQAGIGRKSKVH